MVHHAVDTKQPKTEVGGIPPPNSRPPPQRDTHTSVHHTHRYLKRARYYRCLKKWPAMVYRGFQASKYLLWHGAFFRASSDYSKEISKHCILTNVTSRCARPADPALSSILNFLVYGRLSLGFLNTVCGWSQMHHNSSRFTCYLHHTSSKPYITLLSNRVPT